MEVIVIFGCGGHGRSVGDIVLANDPRARIVYVDDAAKDGEKILGFSVFRDPPAGGPYSAIIGIGVNERRKRVFEYVSGQSGFTITSVISRTAYLGQNAQIAQGCFIGNFSHVGPEATVGRNSILNNGCIVDHETVIGHHCHIGPNATVSGRAVIGDLVFVGVGATIIDKVSICSNVIIGAGATVVDNILDPGTYVGTPARKLAR